jgi:shikimate dehydrogenase
MNKINGQTELYALLGYPAKHSLSPLIHNYFFDNYKINAVYASFEVEAQDFEKAFIGGYRLGFSGINLTMPFKEDSLKFINEPDENARATGSVNTVKFDRQNNNIIGFNTDIPGIIKSLNDHGFEWKESNCLVIGAGGAAKSTVYALLQKKIKRVYIHSRNSGKAAEIEILFRKIFPDKIFILKDLDSTPINDIKLLVNCTPIGMKLDDVKDQALIPVPPEWSLKNKFVFEMVYNPLVTPFIKKALHDKAEVIYGTEMLLNQAAFSFEIWTGLYPDLSYLKKHFKIVLNK